MEWGNHGKDCYTTGYTSGDSDKYRRAVALILESLDREGVMPVENPDPTAPVIMRPGA